jgi:hypothetical protein
MEHQEETAETTDPATEQRRDEASGQLTGPPGSQDRDEDAIAAGDERWDKALGSN